MIIPGTMTAVLHEDVSRDAIDDARWENRWCLADIVPGSDSEPSRIVFLTSDRRTVLTYVYEPRVEAKLFMIGGEDPERALREIRATLPIYSREEIARLARQPRDDRELVRGVFYTVLTSADDDTPLLEVLPRAFRHEEPSVRMSALTFAFWAGGPRVREIVQRVADEDDDPDVQDRASSLLESWRDEPH